MLTGSDKVGAVVARLLVVVVVSVVPVGLNWLLSFLHCVNKIIVNNNTDIRILLLKLFFLIIFNFLNISA